jgi:hypothetical protein
LPSVQCKQPWKTKGAEDEYLTIAKVWGNKSKYLHPIQRKIAEKAINDILLEADMGTCTEDPCKSTASIKARIC